MAPSEKNFLFCTVADCEEMVECNKDLNENPFFECPNNHKFCGKCKTPGWHKEGKCNDVKIKIKFFFFLVNHRNFEKNKTR